MMSVDQSLARVVMPECFQVINRFGVHGFLSRRQYVQLIRGRVYKSVRRS